jgi:hypothetical protein
MTSSDTPISSNPLYPRTMRYCGDDEPLKGKTALVTQHGTHVQAQFDDLSLGAVAFSWHRFEVDEFEEIVRHNGG